MSVRINLSLENKLFDLISKQADSNKVSINTEIISILEKIFYEQPFDYSSALNAIINEIPLVIKQGEEFLLNKLPCFLEVSTGTLDTSTHNYIPSIYRARLGADFKNAVKKGLVPNVTIAINADGSEKVFKKTLIYKYN